MYVHHILIDCLFAKQVKSIIFDKNTETAYNQHVPPYGGDGSDVNGTEKQKRNKSIKKAREIFKFHELLSAIKY